jgi:hypothetical protein
MERDFWYGQRLGFKTPSIFRAFREKEPRLYELLMKHRDEYDEASVFLSKQILQAHGCYPQLWFERGAVDRVKEEPYEPLPGKVLSHE